MEEDDTFGCCGGNALCYVDNDGNFVACRVMRYIEEHYTEQISMDAMARLAGLSSTHFNRRFRSLLRMSPTDFLRSLRMQEAQRLLTVSQDSVGEIALASGFYDQSHFTKRFRATTGMTPLAYRKRFR